jgi:hypothetical protein
MPVHAIGTPTVITQEVNLVDCPGSGTVAQVCTGVTTTDAPTTGALGMIQYDPTRYGGSLQVYFEVVLKSSVGTSTASATLYDQTGVAAAVTSAALTTTSTSFVKLTSADIAPNLIGGDLYSVRLKITPSGTTTLLAARLVIRQTFNSGLVSHTSSSVDMANNTTSTAITFADLTDYKIFKYDASKYDGSQRFYLEATMFGSAATAQANIKLFDITDNSDVPMTTATGGAATVTANSLSVKNITPIRLKGEFTAGLADGHEYKLQMSASTATVGKITLARIIIEQKPTIDQQSADETSSNVIDGGATNNRRAQSFTPSYSGYVYGFSAGIGKTGAAHTDLLQLSLRDGLDGNILGDSFKVSPAALSTTTTLSYEFFFGQPVWLTSGTTYYIQAERTGAVDATNTYKLEASTTDTYPRGAAFLKGASWGSGLAFDNYFAVYRQLPTKFETYQQQIASLQTQATATYTLKNYLNGFDPSNNWVRTSRAHYFEATLKTSAGTGFANMRDITTPIDITSSDVSTASTTYVRVRSVDLTSNMPVSAKDLDTQIKNSTTNTTSVSSSRLVIDVTVGPTIAAIAPNKGPVAAGTPLTLYGSGFRPGATLTIGGTAATQVSVISSGQMSASAPAGSAGSADVVVTNTDGTTETFGKAYTYATEQFAVTKSAATDFSAGTQSNTETVGVKLDQSNWLWTGWTGSTTGGSIATGTYYYKVTALDAAGNETTPSPQAPATTTTGATSSILLSWRPIVGATQYKVYRTTTSGTYTTPAFITTLTTTQSSPANSNITYNDTAASTSAGAPPGTTNSVNGIGMSYGTVPSAGAGTFSAGPTLSSALYYSAISMQRPDGKFFVLHGRGSTATSIYDPVANTDVAGPVTTASVFEGAHAIQRPDGKFLFLLCGTTTNTNIYDPIANTIAAGPALSASAGGTGTHSIKRPDGKFLIMLGANSLNTSIYDPVANIMIAGPSLPTSIAAGAQAIQRFDGKYLILIGNLTTTTTIYDPMANTFAAGPALSAAAQYGAHSLQRPDGKFLIIHGNSLTSTSLYDPVNNTMLAGPTLTVAPYFGSHSLQRPDGKFLIVIGNGTTTTNIYDPIANTIAAGPTLSVGANDGSHSIQRPDGKFLTFIGNNTTTTSIYDAGWLAGTTAQNGTPAAYTSEALNPTGNSGWNKLAWQHTSSNDINKVEVRTASTSGGLAGATYRIVSNGQDIAPAAGEIWLQYKITFIRTTPNFNDKNSGNFTNVRMGEAAVDSNRDFSAGYIPSISATYSKLQASSIAPNVGPTAGATPFTITGTGFSGNSTVTIGGASATNVFVVSSTTITGVTPSGTTGAKDVVVTNPSISLTATLIGGYTYGTNTQTVKNNTASFTTAGSSLTNLNTSGIDLSGGVFQWQDWTPSTTGGSISAGTYYYKVTATDLAGGETIAGIESAGSIVTGTTASVSLKWRQVPGAAGYKVYRTVTSGTYLATSLVGTVSVANSSTINTSISYIDTATAASTGAPPASNTTASELTLSRGTVPSAGQGTVSAAGPSLMSSPSNGSHSIQRPDGKFLIILGGISTITNIYDPVANTIAAGPALPATAGAGSHSIQRPDGKFLIILGNGTTATTIYDPLASTFATGPSLFSTASYGSNTLQRPDGKFLIILQNNQTNIYDPLINTMTLGPDTTIAGGSHSIRRPDGTFLIIMGNASSVTNIYDPVANTMVAGPALSAVAGAGSHSIQRQDNKFLIILGENSAATSIYDPVNNSTAAGPNLLGIAHSGANSLQRSDGKFLIMDGNATTTTNIYDPVTNAITAGPALLANAQNGAHSFQRQDGKFVMINGSGNATLYIYDAGWSMGTSVQNGTVGTYISEDQSTTAVWDKVSWTKSIENTIQSSAGTVNSIEVKTAGTQAGLTSATYREVANGGAISPGACETWLKVKITFSRPQATWTRADHPGANVWLGESSTFENRTFDAPTIQSLTVQSAVGSGGSPPVPTLLNQYHSDGASPISTGGATSEDKTVMASQLTSGNVTDSLTLQLEIQDINTSFTGTPNYNSASVPCGSGTCSTGVVGTINVTDRAPGQYHWQVRSSGGGGCGASPSAWVPYPVTPTNGDAPPAYPDFTVVGAQSLMRGGKTFVRESLQPSCATLFCK